MKKAYLDTNVIIDLLLDRKPFSDYIADIFEIAELKSISLCVSSLTVANTSYIIGRLETKRKAGQMVSKLLKLVNVENVGQSTVQAASDSSFKDFEDAIQNFCAIEAEHQILVTRDTKDFKTSQLSIMNPKEFLTKLLSL